MTRIKATVLALCLSAVPFVSSAQFPPGFGIRAGAPAALSLLQQIRAAQIAYSQGQWQSAAEAAQEALAKIEQAQKADPSAAQSQERFTTLKILGRSLLREGKAEQAVPYLKEALAMEDFDLATRLASGDPGRASMSTREAMAAFQAAMSVSTSLSRHLGRAVFAPGMLGGAVEAQLADRLPESNLTIVDLIEAHALANQSDEAYALFESHFEAYLDRQASNTNPNARQNLDVAVEVACLRMGIALTKFGRSPQADRAFACALQVSAKNFVALGLGNTVGMFMESFADQRRLLLGAYASYLRRSGSLDGDDPLERKLVELVAETKGISSRYRERRRAIWSHSRDPSFFRGRQAFVEHDRQLTQMDVTQHPMVTANIWAGWLSQESQLMAAHHETFRRAGLLEVFVPGETILDRTQELLRKGPATPSTSALIGYAIYRPVNFETLQLSASRMLRYVIAADSVEIRDLGDVMSLNQQVRRWRNEVIAGNTRGGKADNLQRTQDLSRRLLGALPIAAQQAQHWVVDPDGVLSLLPFESLADPTEANAWVIERRTLHYVSSIASFAETAVRRKVEGSGNSAVVVGDPVFPSASEDASKTVVGALRTSTGKTLRELSLTPLPDTRDESLRVAASLKKMGVSSQVHLGKEASPAAFAFESAPRFLHVATHGFFLEPDITLDGRTRISLAPVIPGMQSALALSPTQDSAERSSFLTGADITRLNLRGTELVVFSACDTGNGEVVAGEGVVSLRRSVEEAGARSSVTSLWPVPSASTARLMVDFYENLGSGLGKAQALRQAKLSMLKSSPDPVHWAGFLLAGEP